MPLEPGLPVATAVFLSFLKLWRVLLLLIHVDYCPDVIQPFIYFLVSLSYLISSIKCWLIIPPTAKFIHLVHFIYTYYLSKDFATI